MEKYGKYSDYTFNYFNFEILNFLPYLLKIYDCFVIFL